MKESGLMKEEKSYNVEFLNGEMNVDLTPTITRFFVKHGISLQWYEDETKNNKSENGNLLVYLHLTYKRHYKYSLMFEVLEDKLKIPKGSIVIAQKEFYDILIGFINLINAHAKVYISDKDNNTTFAYEYRDGKSIYDFEDKSFSQSTVFMLIDFYLAELKEAIVVGDKDKINEINDILNSYKVELNRF